MSKPSVGFVSLGCAKNLVDSQIMADRLLQQGFSLAPRPEEADAIIVNTCAFIEDARQESLEHIFAVCEYKDDGPCRAIIVTGCLPQRYRTRLSDIMPDVDAFVGIDELDHIGSVISRALEGSAAEFDVGSSPSRVFDPTGPGVVFSGGPFAYLKISEGCNHRCAFCAIPKIRGRHRSRRPDSIVAEAESLLEAGFRELNIVSQDTTAYGSDLDGNDDLCSLLRKLGQIGGDFWVRILYAYPDRVTQELLDTVAEIPQVCHYFDVPIQHSHPDILRAMRRASTAKHVSGLPERIRRTVPDAAVRTTCLVGFPGETDSHFEHLLKTIGDSRFDHLGIFTYSPEEGTSAADMDATPDQDTADGRRDRLMELQLEIVRKRNAELVGSEDKLLLERYDEGEQVWLGRTYRQAPDVDGLVLVEDAPADCSPGAFAQVRYTSFVDYDMKAAYIE